MSTSPPKATRQKNKVAKKVAEKGKSDPASLNHSKVFSSISNTIESGGIARGPIQLLKKAETTTAIYAAVSELEELTTAALTKVMGENNNSSSTYKTSLYSSSPSSEASAVNPLPAKFVIVGAPNSANVAPDSGCRLDPLLEKACLELGETVIHVPDGLTRVKELETPAKSRPDLYDVDAVTSAVKLESDTVQVSYDLGCILNQHRSACIIIVDDISSTGITLESLSNVVHHRLDGDAHKVKLLALHTTSSLAGIATNTLTFEESNQKMKELISTKCKTVNDLTTKDDEGSFSVYECELEFSSIDEGDKLSTAISNDYKASSYERGWAKAWGKKEDGEKKKMVWYIGQVHTVGKTCETRWNEEKSGHDGTGLVDQLRRRLASVRGVPEDEVQWKGRVVFNRKDIQEFALVGGTDAARATDFLEEAVYNLRESSFKNCGANCIVPGPTNWAPMYSRLRGYMNAELSSFEGSGQESWLETDGGQSAKGTVWNMRAVDVAANDDRICDFIAAYFSDKPDITADQLYSEFCRYAGLEEGRLLNAYLDSSDDTIRRKGMSARDLEDSKARCLKAREEMAGSDGVPEGGFVGEHGHTAYTPAQVLSMAIVSDCSVTQVLAQCRAHEGRIEGGLKGGKHRKRYCSPDPADITDPVPRSHSPC
jgi:hypoxanthine phosphoribosyltransferase